MTDAPELASAPTLRQAAWGLSLPLRGLRRIAGEATLWPWFLAPWLVTTALMLVALGLTWTYGVDLTARVADFPTGDGVVGLGAKVGWYLLAAVVHVALLGVTSVVAWTLAGILAAPFYDQLSARVERLELGDALEALPQTWQHVLGDVAQGVAHSLMALTLYAGASCALLSLHLVPVAGEPLYALATSVLSAFYLSREVLDYSFSRRRYPFLTKLRLVRAHARVTGGLGLGMVAVVWIPLVNGVLMPASVVGGTLLFCELHRQGRLPEEEGT